MIAYLQNDCVSSFSFVEITTYILHVYNVIFLIIINFFMNLHSNSLFRFQLYQAIVAYNVHWPCRFECTAM